MSDPKNPFEILPVDLLSIISFYLPPEDIVHLWENSGLWKRLLVLGDRSLKAYTCEYLGIENNSVSEFQLKKEYVDDSPMVQDDCPMVIEGIQEDEDTQGPCYYDNLQNCIEVLKKVSKGNEMSLFVEGFFTDGGVCWNEERWEVYHLFTPTNTKVYSSTLSVPHAASGIHRPNFDKYTWSLIDERIGFFDKFLRLMQESHPNSDKYTIVFWLFEQIASDVECIQSKLDQAIIKGYVNFPEYRKVIKEKYPNIREAQVKNKVAEEIITFYYAFTNAYASKILDSVRDRPIKGIDSVNTVEWNIDAIMTTHKSLSYYACFNQIRITRPKDFTNPAKTMGIFLHNQKLSDPEMEECKKFFMNYEDFFAHGDRFCRSDEELESSNLDIFEIDQNQLDSIKGCKWSHAYRPLSLFRFKDKRDMFGSFTLKQGYVSSRFITVVFLEIDNLSREVNQRYDPITNVDLASIQVFGYSIPSLIYEDEEAMEFEPSI